MACHWLPPAPLGPLGLAQWQAGAAYSPPRGPPRERRWSPRIPRISIGFLGFPIGGPMLGSPIMVGFPMIRFDWILIRFRFWSHRSYKSYRSYKVQNRVANRSSSFLGVNVGLDPVQNLSKSGLRPDYDDQDSKIESNQNLNQNL